jgi:hypothetical protein
MSEKKKEESRRRAKSVRDNARWAQKTGTSRQVTPGVKVVGASLFRDEPTKPKKGFEESLEYMVLAYILRKNGLEITEQTTIPTIYRKVKDVEVADVMIARILGPDEKFGLDRKFFFKSRESFHAHRFPDGTVIEVGLQSYSGYVSRTYYVVDGTEFRPFAQDNFRKTE